MTRQIDIKAIISHIVKGDGENKCRICMGDTSEGQVYLGDTVMMDGEKSVTLAELLESITGVKLIDEYMIPGTVCAQCTSAAIAAQELCNLVSSSQEMWTRAVNGMMPFHSPEITENDLKSLCVILHKEDLSLQFIKDYIVRSKRNTFIGVSHNHRKKVEKKSRWVRNGIACDCPDCGKKFTSPYYLNQHLTNSGQKEACLRCGTVVIRGQGMKDHLFSMHKESTVLCAECPNLYKTESELKTHIKSAHQSRALTCPDCGRTFTRMHSFEAHLQMHAVRTCRACGAQFANRGCYREHRSQCEPDAKPNTQLMPRNRRSNVRDPALYTCDYCGKTYGSRPQLKNHIIWIHMDVRPHQCQWCGKRFYTSARLAEHSVVHTRERNYECDICGAKLVSKMAAVYHRRRHTGEKPYACEECGERFISASRRTEHAKRKHKKGLRCVCHDCGASYVRPIDLRKHVERVHTQQLKDTGKATLLSKFSDPPKLRPGLMVQILS